MTLSVKPGLKVGAAIVYACICLLYPPFLYFMPLVLYDVVWETVWYAGLSAFLPAAVHFSEIPWVAWGLLVLLLLVACLIKYYAGCLDGLKTGCVRLQGDTKRTGICHGTEEQGPHGKTGL